MCFTLRLHMSAAPTQGGLTQALDHTRMIRHDVQLEFSRCVKALGGSVLDEELINPTFSNADFWFPSANVVAELKCLSENYFSRDSFNKSLSDKYQSWVARGLVPRLKTAKAIVNLANLPVQCADEVVQPLKRKLETSTVKKANRQIRETREHLGASNAKGLLLLVNDGNHALPPSMVRHLLARLLNAQYRCINTVVHFSVNEQVQVPGINMPTLFWAQWGFRDRVGIDPEFLEQLRSAWLAHHSTISGGDVYEIITRPDHDPLETLRFSKGVV